MQINISARHGHLSTASQERITEKVDKLRKYFDRITSIQVTVDLEHKDTLSLELRVSAEHSADFVATHTADELMAALDHVIHKVEQQIRKHKERLHDSHRNPGRKQRDVPLGPGEQPD